MKRFSVNLFYETLVPPELPDAEVCAQIAGQIALIDRGQCNFTQKVENAQNCGAIGVIVCNCQPGPGWCSADQDALITMGIGILTDTITIPAVFMRYADCQEIKAELNNGNEVEICIGAPVSKRGCSREFTVDVCDDYPADFCENAPEVQGCIDANACNYNSNANVDDGSCFYSGDVCDDGDTNTVDDMITENCLCRGRFTTCNTSIDAIAAPTQSTLCNDGSDQPIFGLPASSLPDVEIVVEVNGIIVDISSDGTFDASRLNINDEVCYTALALDIAAVRDILDNIFQICALADFPFSPDPCPALFELINGPQEPVINHIEEILNLFLEISNASTNSVDEAIATVNGLNETITPINLNEICYAVSNTICLPVINCNGCPAKPGRIICD